MTPKEFKKLIILVRGLPCYERDNFVNNFSPNDVIKPQYIQTALTKQSAFVRKPTILQQDFVQAQFIVSVQANRPFFIVDNDLTYLEDVEFYQHIAKVYNYTVQIVTFKGKVSKMHQKDVLNGSGVHLFNNRYVDFKAMNNELINQKRFVNEKIVYIKLDSHYNLTKPFSAQSSLDAAQYRAKRSPTTTRARKRRALQE
jgi:hypothetical protein